MYNRAKYRDDRDWKIFADPISSKKYDGAHFYLKVGDDLLPRFISRRESVRGGFPDRTEKVPHLASLVFPEESRGQVYNVELIHTGHDKDMVESHPAVSGILNSLPDKAIATQKLTGPVRAVLLDVVDRPDLTYREKVRHLNQVVSLVGRPDVLFHPEFAEGREAVQGQIDQTLAKKEEGVIVTDGSITEANNFRIKIKHSNTYNLLVRNVIQEVDISGKVKESAGALELEDATGRDVGKVGTGFSRELRREIWLNKSKWEGKKLIQVKALPPTAHKLRSAVYNGEADGSIDTL